MGGAGITPGQLQPQQEGLFFPEPGFELVIAPHQPSGAFLHYSLASSFVSE